MSDKLEDLLSEYWDAAYAEGVEGRSHDTIDGRAQKAMTALREHYEALERRLAEVERQRRYCKICGASEMRKASCML